MLSSLFFPVNNDCLVEIRSPSPGLLSLSLILSLISMVGPPRAFVSGWCPKPQCFPHYHRLFPLPVLQAGGSEKVAGLPDVLFQMDALLLFPLRFLDVVRQKNKTRKQETTWQQGSLHSRHFFLAFPPLTQSDSGPFLNLLCFTML